MFREDETIQTLIEPSENQRLLWQKAGPSLRLCLACGSVNMVNAHFGRAGIAHMRGNLLATIANAAGLPITHVAITKRRRSPEQLRTYLEAPRGLRSPRRILSIETPIRDGRVSFASLSSRASEALASYAAHYIRARRFSAIAERAVGEVLVMLGSITTAPAAGRIIQ